MTRSALAIATCNTVQYEAQKKPPKKGGEPKNKKKKKKNKKKTAMAIYGCNANTHETRAFL